MKAFEVEVHGKKLDYRVGKTLDLKNVQEFFEKTYSVTHMQHAGRHVIGQLKKGNQQLFLKVATTEGISHITQNEYHWNDYFNQENARENSPFWVPKNHTSGFYKNTLFYMVTDMFEGKLLSEKPEKTDTHLLRSNLSSLIAFTERIQALPNIFGKDEVNAQQFFREKAQAWFDAIPQPIREQYAVQQLLDLVENTYNTLETKPRHGDFTPWHIFSLADGKLGLIDGEHARGNGVEHYDIAYCIQRIFAVLEDIDLAKDIVKDLEKRKYDLSKVQTVLAARGIGGFLDESLKENPNYSTHDTYKEFVLSLI